MPTASDLFQPQRSAILLLRIILRYCGLGVGTLLGPSVKRIPYASHSAHVEGVHGEEKASHALARAVRRGLANMKIQAYLTVAAVKT
jgi:hypothetical protein